MENRSSCAICYNNKLNNIFNVSMPTKLSCTLQPICETSSLSFAQCDVCNTIQLDKLVPLPILYSDSHNYNSVGQVWDKYFATFVSLIENIIIDKNILEIGDPSGKIANRCENFNKWFIVEPNKNTTVHFNANIEFIEKFFDETFQTDHKIDIIIHSHLLEHIYDPNIFLKKCYEMLTYGGEMIFGVPNMEHICQKEIAPCLGIFFEHTIFLNVENISWLLNRQGFQIINCVDYESHSILFHVKKVSHFSVLPISISNYNQLFFTTLNKYKTIVNYCNNFIEKNPNKPVYIFGASYNTQFLLSLGVNVHKIDGILDNCKDKHQCFLYGYNLQIFPPEIVKNIDCIIILKNGYYSNEIQSQLLSINSNITILM